MARIANAAPDMSKHVSRHMPKAGVQYPKGKDKADLIAGMRQAFSKTKVRQTA